MILLAQRLIDHCGVDAAHSEETCDLAKELDRLCTYHHITQDREITELVSIWGRANRRFRELSDRVRLAYPGAAP
jgi:hypothetical protein